jgi:hypothetical protein
MADAQNWVTLWQGFDNPELEEDQKQMFLDKMGELYETEEVPTVEADLSELVVHATAFSAFMISFYTGRTRESFAVFPLYRAYVMTEDGEVIVPQNRIHLVLQLMVCSYIVASLPKENRGDGRESLKKLRVASPVELVTNKEAEYSGDWSPSMRLFGLTAYPVLRALVETGFCEYTVQAGQLAALTCITEGQEQKQARQSLKEVMEEFLQFEDGEGTDVTWTKVLNKSHATQYAIFAFAMWAVNIFK